MDELYAALERMNQSYRESNGIYHEIAVALHLTDTMFYIFYALAEDYRPLDQHRLCTDWNLPKQTVNAVITGFYKKGWVQLRELPEDRRNKTVHLTEAGAAEAERILQRVRQSEQQAMSGLTEEERAVLLSATRRYVTGCKDAMKGL